MKHLGTLLIFTGSLLLSACGFSSLPDDLHADGKEKASQSSAETSLESRQDARSSDSSAAESFPDLHSFEATTVTGDHFSPEDFTEADVTAINIWSTTCAPCVREMPELAEYAGTLPENLRIITWCVDANISATGTEIEKYMNECGFHDVTLASGDGDMQILYSQLMYTPTTVFVDAKGNMVAEPLIGAGNIAERYSMQFEAALEQLGIESAPQ